MPLSLLVKNEKVLDLATVNAGDLKCQRLISLFITHFKEHIQNCYINKITDSFNIVLYQILIIF